MPTPGRARKLLQARGGILTAGGSRKTWLLLNRAFAGKPLRQSYPARHARVFNHFVGQPGQAPHW